MNAKDFLRQIRKIKAQIAYKTSLVEELRAKLTSISVPLDGDHVQLSHSDKLAGTLSKIMALEEDINADIQQLTVAQKKIMEVVDQLDEPYISLIYKRYFELKPWEQIAREMHYSVRWLTGYVNHQPGIHIRALNEVQRILDSQSLH